MKVLASALLAVAVALTAAQPSAGAPVCVAPPGTAAIDQYCEIVLPPKRFGDKRVRPREISRPVGERLVQTADGYRLLAVTGPYEVRDGPRRTDDERATGGHVPGTFGSFAQSIGDAGVFGIGFMLILLTTAVAQGAWALARRP